MKTSNILIIVTIMLLSSCSSDLSYEEQIKNYNDYVSKADSLLLGGNYKSTITYSDSAIKITDTLPRAYLLKGIANLNLNLLDEAEDNFEKVIDLEGKTSKAYKNRAIVYLEKNDSDFLEDINIYLDNYPSDEEAHILKREYLEKKNDFDKAIEEYNIAINKDKNNLDLYIKRSELHYKNGDYKNSLNDYNSILSLDPENTQIKEKKKLLETLMFKNHNRNIFVLILLGVYLFYIVISFLVLKPSVNKKALNQIGGNFEISKDPLIWVLPIILTLLFLALYFNNLIPNF